MEKTLKQIKNLFATSLVIVILLLSAIIFYQYKIYEKIEKMEFRQFMENIK